MSRTTIYTLVGLTIVLILGAGLALISAFNKTTETVSVVLVPEEQKIEAIQEYLTYSEFVKPNFDGRVFTAIYKLGDYSTPQEYIMYVWAHSQEYYEKDKVLTEGSGATGPIVVHMSAGGSRVTRIDMPGNGSQYWDDVQRLFPAHIVQNEMFTSSSSFYISQIKTLTADAKSQAELFYSSKGGPSQVSKNIVIDNLSPGATVSSPLIITGKAKGWYFEGSFGVKVIDGNGTELVSTYAQAEGDWMTTEFVPFKTTLVFTPITSEGTIIFSKDNPSGLSEHDESFSLPVRFSKSSDSMTVNLYYQNTKIAQSVGDECSPASVVSVNRVIPRPVGPLGETIKLLLQGNLTQAEKNAGFTTEFPEAGFELVGANIKDGVAILEFTEVSGFTSGGSCRVTILRSQVEKTALQFPEIKSVEIRPESIFQP